MANKYTDKQGFYHDKPCVDGVAASNNKFLYTAQAHLVGLENSFTNEMLDEMLHCWRHKVRHSFKTTSPVSRDEIMALCYLIPNFAKELIENDFWMNRLQPIFNLKRFCKQIIELYKNRKDRNYWHRNNLEQTEFLTMKLPLTDRAFIYRIAMIKPPLHLRLIETVDKKFKPSGRSSAAIRSFKYNLDNFEGIRLYHKEDHPIRLHIEKLRNKV